MPTEKYAREHFAIEKNKIVKTRFVSTPESVKVQLLDYPDPERLKKVFVNFSEGSWFENFYEQADKSELDKPINDLFEGKMLGQALEHPNFYFLVSGLTLNDSHALVRSRIGICFIQQSGAVRPQSGDDILVPKAFAKHPELLQQYKIWAYKGKQLYQDMLETGDIAITDARMALPRSIPVWVHVSVNLLALMGLVKKRQDSQEEYPALNSMSTQMIDLVVEKFPYMKGYFKSGCDDKTCMHCKAGYKSNCIFKRDSKHQLLAGVSDNWTLHDKTKFEMMLDCKPFETEYYVGTERVSKSIYDESSSSISK